MPEGCFIEEYDTRHPGSVEHVCDLSLGKPPLKWSTETVQRIIAHVAETLVPIATQWECRCKGITEDGKAPHPANDG